jgi:hypothetical protein
MGNKAIGEFFTGMLAVIVLVCKVDHCFVWKKLSIHGKENPTK